MKAVAVFPGKPGSAHLTDIPEPSLDGVPGVRDMAMSEAYRPGWLARLMTHPIAGLDRYADALSALTRPGVIKTYIEIGA